MFWEDNWLGSDSMAIVCWELYVIVNEKKITLADVWDGSNVKCTFRRCADVKLMNMWLEVVQLAQTIQFFEEESLIWQFDSKGQYTSQSLYIIVNF